MIPRADLIKREKFKPRATKCSHCPKYDKQKQHCTEFNWGIKISLAKRQAVCDDRPTEKG